MLEFLGTSLEYEDEYIILVAKHGHRIRRRRERRRERRGSTKPKKEMGRNIEETTNGQAVGKKE